MLRKASDSSNCLALDILPSRTAFVLVNDVGKVPGQGTMFAFFRGTNAEKSQSLFGFLIVQTNPLTNTVMCISTHSKKVPTAASSVLCTTLSFS